MTCHIDFFETMKRVYRSGIWGLWPKHNRNNGFLYLYVQRCTGKRVCGTSKHLPGNPEYVRVRGMDQKIGV